MTILHPQKRNDERLRPTGLKQLKDWLSRYWIIVFALGSIVLLVQAIYILGFLSKGSYPLQNLKVYKAKYAVDIHAIHALPDDKWKTTERLLFSNANEKVWLKFEIPAEIAEQKTLLRFNDPLIDKIELFVFEHSGNAKQLKMQFSLGDTLAFEQRLFELPNVVVPFKASEKKLTVYVTGTSKLSLNLSMGLWSSQDFMAYNGHHKIFFGAICGYILSLVCYSLMMFATARKPEYMWYCAYLIGFSLHILTLSGFGYQYLWPNSPALQSVMGGTTISLSFLFLVKFTEILIIPSKRIQIVVFRMIVFACLAIALLSLLTLHVIFVKLALLVIFIVTLLMPILCFSIDVQGSKVAKFLGLMWTIMLMGGGVSMLDRLQILPLNLDATLTLVVAFHIETLLIGSALIYGYQSTFYKTIALREAAIKDEAKAIKAKDQILSIQKDAQLRLEAQVKAQTQQLEGALSELSKASVELEQLRNIDGLTGLPNRLAFDEALFALAEKAIDNSLSLQLAVIDIDHFKQVNDTYGHLAGDECLRVFSALIKESFNLSDYAYCRYGGEEFVLASLLPLEQVEARLNVFKDRVQALQVCANGADISFTTSAGLAGENLKDANDTRKLYSKADEKLYQAKQNGRNLVVA